MNTSAGEEAVQGPEHQIHRSRSSWTSTVRAKAKAVPRGASRNGADRLVPVSQVSRSGVFGMGPHGPDYMAVGDLGHPFSRSPGCRASPRHGHLGAT